MSHTSAANDATNLTPLITQAGLLDAASAWRMLSAEVRDKVGIAAITHALGLIGSCQGQTPAQGWAAAELEGMVRIEELLRSNLPSAFRKGLPIRPDVTVLQIAACRSCGCTDRCGCEAGCSWFEPDLCSSCANGDDPSMADGDMDDASTETPEEVMRDLRDVGPAKPMGYLPLQSITEFCGIPLADAIEEAQVRGLTWCVFEESPDSHIVSGALYVWDRAALGALLQVNRDILAIAEWPLDPDDFVAKVDRVTVYEDIFPALYELIGAAFADERFREPRRTKRPVTTPLAP